MAQINFKSTQRYRFQISIAENVWKKYDANQKKAILLGVEIDYTAEFESWLKRQNDEVEKKLAQISASAQVVAPPSQVAPAQATVVAVASKSVAAAAAIPAEKLLSSGGGQDGNN